MSPDGVETPIIIFRIVARLIGSTLMSGDLSVNITDINDPAGGIINAQAQPMVLSFWRGDIQKPEDGIVDIIDAMFGAQYTVGIRSVTDIRQVNMASVKHDGTGDIKDIVDCMFIAQYVVGIRNEYFELNP